MSSSSTATTTTTNTSYSKTQGQKTTRMPTVRGHHRGVPLMFFTHTAVPKLQNYQIPIPQKASTQTKPRLACTHKHITQKAGMKAPFPKENPTWHAHTTHYVGWHTPPRMEMETPSGMRTCVPHRKMGIRYPQSLPSLSSQ